MQIQLQTFTVNKRFPLTISRGTTAQSTNIWVRLEHNGIEGWGEASPFKVGKQPQNTQILLKALQHLVPQLEPFHPLDRQAIEARLAQENCPTAAWAAIDMALHDWMGKQVNLPLWRLWGLDCSKIPLTSVTIGISSPEAAVQRVRNWLPFTGGKVLKVKLGNPEGLEADLEMLRAIREEAPNAQIMVDANGGWSLDEAIKMCNLLPELGVIYVEQPLDKGKENELGKLKAASPLPIFVDESCFNSRDISKLADSVDGINIKLMKSGGLTEAMRMIGTAKAYGLQVMIGCYSDSVLSNSAAAQLTPLLDYVDLDSQLNLIDDPFSGATLQEGKLIPSDLPGLGVTLSN